MTAANRGPQRRRTDFLGFVPANFTNRHLLQSFARFASIGVLATLIHGLMLNLLVLSAGLHPTMANVGAFLSAFMVSYLGHYYFSFRSREDHIAAAPKYLGVALIGLALNTLIFAVIVNLMQLHYMIAFAAVIVILPPIIFVISRTFVFTTSAEAPAGAASLNAMRQRLICYAPACLFFMITALYVALFYFRAPYFDQWSFISLYRLMSEGVMGAESMFALHGAHWHATAYMVLYGLAELTGMNHFYESAASLAFAVLGFLGLAQIITRATSDDGDETLRPLLLGLGAAFWFSLDQALNWLWGWQVAVYINTAGAVWCIALLTSPSLTALRFALGLVAASASILSFATGLTLLPIGLGLLFFQIRWSNDRKNLPAKVYFGLWTAFSVAILTIYWRLNFAADGAYGREVAAAPNDFSVLGDYAFFFVNFIASPITRFATDLAAPVVAAGGYLVIWAVRRSDINIRQFHAPAAMLGLLALMAYGVGAGVLTGLGRAAEFGASQGFSSRYITFGNFIWIGAIVMALIFAARDGALLKRVSAPVIIISILCVLKAGNAISTGKNYAEEALNQPAAIDTLIAARPDIDEHAILVFTNTKQDVEEDIDFLESRDLSFFRGREEAE